MSNEDAVPSLKPCPFCAHEAQVTGGTGPFFGRVQVECSACRIATFWLDEDVARQLWNRRAPTAEQAEAVPREEIVKARDRVLEQSKNSLFRSGVKICAGEILSPTEPCDKPPAGWTCSRIKGHEGPCAASAAASTGEQA